MSDILARRKFVSHSQNLKSPAELISNLWCIVIKKSKATVEATIQQGAKSAILPLSRRYRSNRVYIFNRLNSWFSIDTLFSEIKSLNQNVCAQVFCHKVGFSATYPIQAGSGYTIGQSYKYFYHDYGVP